MSELTDAQFLGTAPPPASPPAEMNDDQFLGAQPTLGTTAEAPFVGFNSALANTAGAPVDFLNWLGSKAGLPVSKTPFGGSESIRQGLGLIGANPELHPPRSGTERLLQSAGAGAGAMLTGGLGAEGIAAGATPKVANAARLLFGTGETVPEVATTTAIGAGAGAAAQKAEDYAPENLKPLAGTLANLAVGSIGAAPSAARSLRRFVEPMSAEGQKVAAGRKLLEASQNPAALHAGAENPQEIIPGSEPTLFQQTGDQGIGQLEAQVARSSPANTAQFLTRKAEQNTARLAALPQSSGDPQEVAGFLRSHVDNLNQRADAYQGIADQQAQQAATKIGGAQSPEYYGQQINNEIMPQLQGARQQAAEATDTLGGGSGPEVYGSAMREAAANAAEAARVQRNNLYRAVDPDKGLNLVAEPVSAQASRIINDLGPLAAKPDPIEGSILQDAHGLPPVVRYSDLIDFDQRITAAMQAEQGRTPAWGRLSQLKSAVQSAIDNGVANQVAYERAQVARQAMAGEDTIEGRVHQWGAQTGTDGGEPWGGPTTRANASFVAQPNQSAPRSLFDENGAASASPAPAMQGSPQSLLGFLRHLGGIQDQGGELTARDYRRQFPGLVNNRSGLPLDRAREAAAEAGYLGADTEHAVRSTRIDDLLKALDSHPTYSAHDLDRVLAGSEKTRWEESERRYHAAREEIASNLHAHGHAMRDSELVERAAELMVDHRMNWDDALERAAIEAETAESEARYYAALSNGAPQGPRSALEAGFGRDRAVPKEGMAGTGRGAAGNARQSVEQAPAVPNFAEADAERLAAAKAAHANYAQTFQQGPVGGILKDNGFRGQYVTPPSAVPDKLFQPGAKGFEVAKAFRDAVKDDPSAISAMHNYAASSLRRAAARPDGTLDPAKFRAWQAKYQQALRAFPELASRFDTAVHASQALERFEPFRPDLSPSLVPETFFHAGPSGFEGVRDLRRLIGDDKANSILSDYAASHLRNYAANPDGSLNPNKVETWMRQHAEAMRAFPELAKKFKDAAQATKTVAEVAATRKRIMDDYQKGAIGKLMGASDPSEVTRMVGGILGQKDSVTQMQRLADIVEHNPQAKEGLRKAVVDHIVGKFISNTEAGTSGSNILKSDAFQSFIRENAPALAKVFSSDELNSMRAVAADLKRANRSIASTKLPGGSDTAQYMIPALKGHAEQAHDSLLGVLWKSALLAKEGGEAVLGGAAIPLAMAGAVGKHMLNSMRDAGIKKRDELVKDALLNPDVAAALLKKVPSKPDRGSAITAAQRLRRISVFSMPNAYSNQ